MSKVGIDRMGC